jgi:uncharacterized protein (TIGR00106 family)
MVLAELTIFPTDKGVSVSPYVARVVGIIRGSGLEHQLTPMSTIIEGSWEQVMDVVTKCFKALEPDCERINGSLKIDYRRGEASRMRSKVEKVEEILGRGKSAERT